MPCLIARLTDGVQVDVVVVVIVVVDIVVHVGDSIEDLYMRVIIRQGK